MREYTTQMDAAKKGIITREMEIVANKESKNPEEIRSLVAEGKVAIPANINHKSLSPEGVGQGLKTKINVNLGALYGSLKDFSKAINLIDNATSTYKVLKDSSGMANAYNARGLIHVYMKEYEIADKFFRDAL